MVKYKRLKSSFNNASDSKKLMLMIAIFMLIGSIVGSIMANRMNEIQYSELKTYMDNFFYNFNQDTLIKQEVVMDSFIIYGVNVILIWFLGFIALGSFITFFLLTLRGTSIGFTTSFLIMEYGLRGLWYAIVIYMPQNIILVPVYFFIVYSSIKFTLEYVKDDRKKRAKSGSIDAKILEYVVVLILSLTLIFLISLYEAYIAPNLIHTLLLN